MASVRGSKESPRPSASTPNVNSLSWSPSPASVRSTRKRSRCPDRPALDESGIAQIATALNEFDPADPATLPLRAEDARQAAARGTVVITTMSPSSRAPAALRLGFRAIQAAALRLLHDQRVTLAVGSDNVADTSKEEAEHLLSLGVLDNRALLTMWTETTARAIFPQRRIGRLPEGYEANFLALEGNPLLDWQQVRRIRFRFKQGIEVQRERD